MRVIAVSLALIPLLGACATITKDTQQEIQVTTSPISAHCTLTNGAGRWEIADTPAAAVVDRHFSPLNIHCTSPEHTKGAGVLMPKTDPRAYGNIALGGVPALVDAHTGAGYAYDPAAITIELH